MKLRDSQAPPAHRCMHRGGLISILTLGGLIICSYIILPDEEHMSGTLDAINKFAMILAQGIFIEEGII